MYNNDFKPHILSILMIKSAKTVLKAVSLTALICAGCSEDQKGIDASFNPEDNNNNQVVTQYELVRDGETTIVELGGKIYKFDLKSSNYESAIIQITNYSK